MTPFIIHPYIVLPEGEDWASPKARKLAYGLALTDTGWLSRCSAAGTVADDEGEEEDDEEVTGRRLGATEEGAAPRERLAYNAREMPMKTPSMDDPLASQVWSVPEPLGEGGGGGCSRHQGGRTTRPGEREGAGEGAWR